MRHIFYHWLIKFLVLSILVGGFPISEGQLWAQSLSEKQTKKKKSTRKKTSTKKRKRRKPTKSKAGKAKRPATKKKTGKARKKAPAKRTRTKRTRKPTSAKQPSQEKKVASQETISAPKEKISIIELSNELYELTEALTTSSRQLAHATSYLQPYDRKKVVKIESRPFFTTKDLELAADKNPNDIRVQRELGLHYESIHEYELAKDIYLRLLARDPLNPDFHFYLGSLYASTNEMGKAQHSFEEALDIQSDHKATIDAMAAYFSTPDKKQMSQDVLLRSSKKDPEGPAQKITIIRGKIQDGDYQEAIRLADESLKQYPDRSGFQYLKGVGYDRLGETDKAKVSFQNAIKQDVKNKEAHLALANLYYGQGKYVYAALAFSDAVYIEPMDIDARYMQGLSYYNANEWGRAAAAWEDLLHYKPNHQLVRNLLPQTYYILAVEYNRLGKSTLGRTSFKKALSVNQNTHSWLPGSLRTLGKYYREKVMYKESLTAYQEVIELSPSDASAFLGVGITYWKMHEPQLAKAAWEKSLQLNPDSNEAKGWLILSSQDF